jgi:SAM-dependent methyltransferase
MIKNTLIIESTKYIGDLCELGVKYPTDKSPYNTQNYITPNGSGHRHPYTSVYDLLFATKRFDNIKIAEIGVLDNMSMRCWREYFPNAKLFGFDNNINYLFEGRSLNLKDTLYDVIDVKETHLIEECLNKYDKFDIIIDDSTHQFFDQINILKVAHKFLNAGGVLIIEDIFRHINDEEYHVYLEEIKDYYSLITFVLPEHELKYSPGWNNDKILILVRNENKYNNSLL